MRSIKNSLDGLSIDVLSPKSRLNTFLKIFIKQMSAVISSKHLILEYLDVAREKEITDSKNTPKIQTYFSSPTGPALG